MVYSPSPPRPPLSTLPEELASVPEDKRNILSLHNHLAALETEMLLSLVLKPALTDSPGSL